VPHDASGIAKPCFSGVQPHKAKRQDRIAKLKSRISSSSRLYVEVVRSFATFWRKTTVLLLLIWLTLASFGYFHYFFLLLFGSVLVYLTARLAQSVPQYYRKYTRRRLKSLQREQQHGRPGLGYDPVRGVGRVRGAPTRTAIPGVHGSTPYEQLRRAVYQYGYRPCLGTSQAPTSQSYAWITYDALYRRVCHFGSGVCNLEIPPGARIGLVCRSSANAIVVVKACQAFGWVLVPLFDAERSFMLRCAKHSAVAAIVCDRASTLRVDVGCVV
jgi:AMP-binding enzyme